MKSLIIFLISFSVFDLFAVQFKIHTLQYRYHSEDNSSFVAKFSLNGYSVERAFSPNYIVISKEQIHKAEFETYEEIKLYIDTLCSHAGEFMGDVWIPGVRFDGDVSLAYDDPPAFYTGLSLKAPRPNQLVLYVGSSSTLWEWKKWKKDCVQ